MTTEQKCILAINRGYTYDKNTGLVFSRFGSELKAIKNGYLYISIQIDKRKYQLYIHQFAWYYINKEVGESIDHINGIKNDNRIINLRSLSHQKNMFNIVNAKGYSWHKRDKKWVSQISINGRTKSLGYFNNELDAREAYLKAKSICHII